MYWWVDNHSFLKTWPWFAGMVKETGEGTARFLHSVVKGEIDAREGQSSQAQRALHRVSNVETQGEDCKETAMSLVRNANLLA